MARLTALLFISLYIFGALAQDIPVTTIPDNTTTTATTTPATTTTTESTTTTSSTPPTTTPTTAPPTTTTTPEPVKDDYFRVTDPKTGVSCMMFAGDIRMTVTYPTTLGDDKSASTSISVPRPSNTSVDLSVSGSCDSADGSQDITVSWGPTNGRSSYKLMFNTTDENKWELLGVETKVYITEPTFVNATDSGKYLSISGQYPGLSYVKVDTNASLTCHAAITTKNFTVEVGNANTTTYEVSSTVIGLKMQAFNFINGTGLQAGDRCSADMTSDLVPIAVGCALAGLVLLVLISYLVGRRRRSTAYQSV